MPLLCRMYAIELVPLFGEIQTSPRPSPLLSPPATQRSDKAVERLVNWVWVLPDQTSTTPLVLLLTTTSPKPSPLKSVQATRVNPVDPVVVIVKFGVALAEASGVIGL